MYLDPFTRDSQQRGKEMPELSAQEVLLRLQSERFNANLAAMAKAPEPTNPVHKVQHAAAVEIAAQQVVVRETKGIIAKFAAAKHLGALLEAYANTYAQHPSTY
jgi:hypothetical protein